MGFFAAKTLLTAVEFELFTLLADSELSGREIQSNLGLHDRNLYDFLDALVALGFLQRRGIKEIARYSNAGDVNLLGKVSLASALSPGGRPAYRRTAK